MPNRKKRWGDRSDAVWLRDLPAMNRIMPFVMPGRTDNEAYINVDIDLRPLDRYLAKLNEGRTEDKYTYFHLISAAIAKAFVLRPRMNRFICNNKIYQRNNITVSFVVKKKFDDRAEEGLAFFEFDPKDTLESYHGKIMNIIHKTRRDGAQDTSSGAMDVITKLPQWLIHLIISTTVWLDKHGWAPQFLIGSDPNHAAIFLTNLGSIGLEGGYHHLANWGTNSCFIVIGKKHFKQDFLPDGTPDVHEVIPVGITLDERIADGYYYSGTVALVKELLLHPELLELPADSEVEFSIKR